MHKVVTYIDGKKYILHLNYSHVSYLQEIVDDWNDIKEYKIVMSDGSSFIISKKDGEEIMQYVRF